MKKLVYELLFSALLLTAVIGCSKSPLETSRANDILWYDKPASIWEEYVPLGNGRLGMMPRGGVVNEHVVLNEISMWSGSEYDYRNPSAAESLPKIRKYLFEGKNDKAQNLMYETFVPRATSTSTYGSYQMLANLNINFDIDTASEVKNYRRVLDMKNGIATTDFTVGGSVVHREFFTSRNDDVMVVSLNSTRPMSFSARISRPERGSIEAEGKRLTLTGELDSGQDDIAGVKYKAIMAVSDFSDGTTFTAGDSLVVKNSTNVLLIISATTNYLGGLNYHRQAAELLDKALAKNYKSLREDHIKLHSELYNRVNVELSGNGDSILTTDKRILSYENTQDPAFAALYYNFGRYSLLSSTRPGSLPPNLQGLWCNECWAPWNGDYHTNINVQMNHWPLEPGNLDELYEPLLRLVERSVSSGEETAKAFYGEDARGWVMHMMTNVWNFTAPGEHPSWGATNTGGAWLCEHLYERYEYTLDTTYLRRIFPIMRGAAEFFHSTMVVEPKHKWLVTAPTSSPENGFMMKGVENPVSICMGPTMDIEILTELFNNVVNSANILGVSDDIIEQLQNDIKRFPPLKIASGGYLQEWLEDYEEMDVHHRHVSHLYGLHPSNQISPIETPELANACKVTLDRRGDGGTGWSRAWKINFWARLYDGNRAEKLLKSLFSTAIEPSGAHRSGTFPNLWCSHNPFQLDGNFGGAAGIGEMLLQSHLGLVHPLPALPDDWKSGKVNGMKVKGGAEVSLEWNSGKLVSMSIEGGKANSYNVVVPEGVQSVAAFYASGSAVTLTPSDYKNVKVVVVPVNGGRVDLKFL